MKLLVFEYATAMGIEDPLITAEGNVMLQGLLKDLEKFKPHYLVSEQSENENSNIKALEVNGDLDGWLADNISEYDACLPLVPEEDNLLYNITSTIEKHGVEVIGSNSDAVKITTNKLDTYNLLKSEFPIIKTQQIFFKDLSENMDENAALFENDIPKIVKPADGVSCSGVNVINNIQELIKTQNRIGMHTKLPYFLVQDYIAGVSASVSLLTNGEMAVPLSLNHQDVNLSSGKISYCGGKVPFTHKHSELAKEVAKSAVESIGGLKGYVGVDMIIDEEEVHLVEINSRVTTPYVAIRKLINFNLGEAIIDSIFGKLPSEVKLDGMAKFYKEGKTLRVSVLK